MAKRYTLEDFESGIQIGDGAFSRVVLMTLKETKTQYAAKVLDKAFILRKNKLDTVKNEKAVLNALHHPSICELFCTFQDDASLYFILEYAPNSELFGYINKFGGLKNDVVKFYAAEVILGLEYMHSRGIVHRDMKPENLLLSKDWHVKISDFGTALCPPELEGSSAAAAASADSTAPTGTEFVGTAEYVSPEVLANKPASPASDLWALGCIIFQMLGGKVPFQADSEYLIFKKIQKAEFTFPESNFSPEAKDLISRLIRVNPEERLGAGLGGYAALKAHPYFAGIDWANLHRQTPPQIQPASAPNQNFAFISSFLRPGEKLVYSGIVVKRRKLSAKKRQLVLTDLPRLFYISPEKCQLKGEITWVPGLTVKTTSEKNFVVSVPGRDFILESVDGDAASWCDAIRRFCS